MEKRKLVKAVQPFIYDKINSNFKLPLYDEWVKAGGANMGSRSYKGILESLLYHIDLPTLNVSRREARLYMVEAASLRFDTFPDYLCHETIPVMWDCWPRYLDIVEKWYRKHKVRAAVFTSSQAAEIMQRRIPELQVLTITEV